MTEVNLKVSYDCSSAAYFDDVLSEEVLMLSKTWHVNLGTNEQLSPLALLNRLHYSHLEALFPNLCVSLRPCL